MESTSIALLISMLLTVASTAQASSLVDIAPIGPHVRLFIVEKNENPQNVMVVYAKLDRDCHFAKEDGKAFTDVYWLMDGQHYKPVHPMIKSNITKHIEISSAPTPAGATDAFRVQMSELKEIDPNLDSLPLEVFAKRKGKDCVVETDMMSGKPEKKTLALDAVYMESKKTLLPPFRKLLSLSVKGTNLQTGAKEDRRLAQVH